MNLYGGFSNGRKMDPVMMRKIAMALQSQGRGKDKYLAHINPKEARMLKAMGGSGKINPRTGLMEFQEEDDDFDIGSDGYYGGTGDESDPRADNDYYEYTPSEQEVVNQAIESSQSGGDGDGGEGGTNTQPIANVPEPEPEPDPYSEETYNRSLRESASNLPDFQAYEGEMVAPDPQDVVDAKQDVRDMQTYGRDPVTGEFTDVTTASGILEGVGPDDTGLKGDAQALIDNTISADKITASGLKPEISGFQNQYISSVLQPQLDAIESQRAKSLQNISSGATRSGAFGGSRHGLVESEAIKQAM